MAFESIKNKKDQPEAFSLNQLDPSFYNKIMSRNSSVGNSSCISTCYDSDAKIPLDWKVQHGKPRYGPAEAPSTASIESEAVVRKRAESKKDNLDKKIEARSPRANSSGSASDEFKDFEFLNLDVDETILSTSPRSSQFSPSSMPSPTCSIKPAKSRFQYVARGIVKLATKSRKDSK